MGDTLNWHDVNKFNTIFESTTEFIVGYRNMCSQIAGKFEITLRVQNVFVSAVQPVSAGLQSQSKW